MNNPKTIAVVICATKSYAYALIAQLRRVQAAILQCPELESGVVILVGDNCEQMKAAERQYRESLPQGFEVRRIEGNFQDGLKNYGHAAQLVIARMRSAGFTEARKRKVDICWSLDSDVLPQSNTLMCLIQGLQFGGGIYGVSACPYPSQGGGDFLGGRGTPQKTILPDINSDERIISPALRLRINAHRERFQTLQGKHGQDAAFVEEDKAIDKALKESPAKGDVFFLNSRTGILPFYELAKEAAKLAIAKSITGSLPKRSPLGKKLSAEVQGAVDGALAALADEWKPQGFRRRGWLSSAYPALGWGSMVPADWCGFGCTLMSAYALALAQFDGYEGGGTEDLYICWKRWARNNVRINCIPHAPCDHVIRRPNREGAQSKKGEYLLMQAYHEASDPEYIGHLRCEVRPWFQQTEGEKAPVMAAEIQPKPKPKRRKK